MRWAEKLLGDIMKLDHPQVVHGTLQQALRNQGVSA